MLEIQGADTGPDAAAPLGGRRTIDLSAVRERLRALRANAGDPLDAEGESLAPSLADSTTRQTLLDLGFCQAVLDYYDAHKDDADPVSNLAATMPGWFLKAAKLGLKEFRQGQTVTVDGVTYTCNHNSVVKHVVQEESNPDGNV